VEDRLLLNGYECISEFVLLLAVWPKQLRMTINSTSRVRFNNAGDKAFAEELHREVDAYFAVNKISRHANAAMIFKSVVVVLLLLVPYGILLLFPLPFGQMLLLATVSGIGMVGVGFNIAHDACHNAYSSSPKINRILGLTFNLLGINAYLWKIKHNLSHHTYTNIYHKDEDLLESDNVRLSPDAAYKPIHRFQHIYYFLFYPLYSIIWIFAYDLQIFFRYNGNGSPNPDKKHPFPEVIIFIVTKIAYVFFALIVPFYFIQAEWWKILACFLSMHAVAGIIMASVVKLGHIVDNTMHVKPDEQGVVQNSWMVHELQTSSNFSIHSPLVTWFTGGLNFQVEHHLFPRICSIHYPKLSPIVKAVIQKYHLPYNVNKNMATGLLSHYKFLKRLSVPNAVEHAVS
jgi:linoleoyl-CoA desaturase